MPVKPVLPSAAPLKVPLLGPVMSHCMPAIAPTRVSMPPPPPTVTSSINSTSSRLKLSSPPRPSSTMLLTPMPGLPKKWLTAPGPTPIVSSISRPLSSATPSA